MSRLGRASGSAGLTSLSSLANPLPIRVILRDFEPLTPATGECSAPGRWQPVRKWASPALCETGQVPRDTGSGVYATAVRPGLRTRLADPLARRARAKRRRLYLDLMHPTVQESVLDVGCGSMGLATLGVPGTVTGVDRIPRPDYPGHRFVCADARSLPFSDGEFDIVYSNSLIEHVPPADRERMAADISRVGRRVFVQTPNRRFPVEPHALLPLVHWLPGSLGRRLWRFGVTGEAFEDIQLLDARELRRLFPGTEIVRERVGPLTKSLIAIRR